MTVRKYWDICFNNAVLLLCFAWPILPPPPTQLGLMVCSPPWQLGGAALFTIIGLCKGTRYLEDLEPFPKPLRGDPPKYYNLLILKK